MMTAITPAPLPIVKIINVSWDDVKLRSIAHNLEDAFTNRSHLFKLDSLTPPELILPDGFSAGTKEHAAFLFYTIALDSMRPSAVVYRAGRALVENYDVNRIANLTLNEIQPIVEEHLDNGLGNPAKIIHDCAGLLSQYDGDPRLALNKINHYDDAKKVLTSIYGIGPGKSALLVKNFLRFGYIELDNPFDSPVKIDRHAFRIALGNEALSITTAGVGMVHRSSIEPVLENKLRSICREEEIDPVTLCDAKWLTGANLCAAKSKRACNYHCPLDCAFHPKSYTKGSYFDVTVDDRKETARTIFDRPQFHQQLELL